MNRGLSVDEISVGQTYRKRVAVTEQMIEDFARATGDDNPVHLDKEYARKAVFGRRVAHGMLTAGIIGGVFGTEFPGTGTIYVSQDLKFVKPVFIGDELTIELEVTEVLPDKNRVRVATACTNQRGRTVLVGQAVIMPPEKTE